MTTVRFDLNQITLPAVDLAASIDFYTRFGLTLIVDSPQTRYARFELPGGHATLSLHGGTEAVREPSPHVYFETASPEEAVHALRDRGITPIEPLDDKLWLWREAWYVDPAGNRLCVYFAGENRKNPPWRVGGSPAGEVEQLDPSAVAADPETKAGGSLQERAVTGRATSMPPIKSTVSKKAIAALAVGALAVVTGVLLGVPALLLPHSSAALTTTPTDLGLAFETVRLSVDDPPVSLSGWWMPAESPRGIVVLLHDGGSNRSFLWSQGLRLAIPLTAQGYHVLAPDLRGHGESGAGTGAPAVGGDLAPDVSAWIDFARARAGDLPVAVVGFGLGGQVAILAGAADPRIAAVVADSTWADLRSSLQVSLRQATPLPAALIPAWLAIAEHVYGVAFDRSRAVDVAERLHDRLLLIQNEADPQIPLRQFRWLAGAAVGSEVYLTPAPLPDHPTYTERGSWGTHSQSFVLDPEGYAERLLRFLDPRIARTGSLASRPSD